ncbi:MAG TPA: hypothetical protein VMT37_03510 [Solirubrobacterales bacterium]|nr:hypothetical protein [Solirubrobacterales bacterium]
MRSRPFLALAAFALLALLGAVTATAAVAPAPPRAGAWTTSLSDGGFTLKHGTGARKHKLYVSGLHLTTGEYEACEDRAAPVKVLGSYPLTVIAARGYRYWGVGKGGAEVGERPAKVRFHGKTYNGSFEVYFSTEDPSLMDHASITFASCTTEAAYGNHK